MTVGDTLTVEKTWDGFRLMAEFEPLGVGRPRMASLTIEADSVDRQVTRATLDRLPLAEIRADLMRKQASSELSMHKDLFAMVLLALVYDDETRRRPHGALLRTRNRLNDQFGVAL